MSKYSVNVLLATYNGQQWLKDQISSINSQKGCDVVITASDDLSTDLTPQILGHLSEISDVIVLNQPVNRFGSANSNFLRLIHDADESFDYYAFADQDDIWFDTKLFSAIDHLNRTGHDAYSSDVLAFWPDGRKKYIKKSYIKKPYDFLFESAGPGCTFVFPRRKFLELKNWVVINYAQLQSAKVHDWLIYAFARIHNWKWHIDSRATMLYRQHTQNDFGANIGYRAAMRRLIYVYKGLHRNDILRIAKLINCEDQIVQRLRRFNLYDLFFLILNTHKMRRNKFESLVMKIVFILMFFGRRSDF